MKLETIAIGSRSLSKSNIENNQIQTSTNKFNNTSPATSTISNESSSISSTSSNRTNCIDYDFDTDLSEYCISQSKSNTNEKSKLETNPKIVNIHHHNLLTNFNTDITNTKRRVC
jgi:hypothetical protein